MWNKKTKIFYLLYCLFARWLPESHRLQLANKLRTFFAKKILKKAGENLTIERGAFFTPDVTIGDFSGIGVDCELCARVEDGSGEIKIGDYVMMGPECVIYTASHAHDRIDIPMQKQGFLKPEDVVIGNDVWIGRRVTIMPGVTIGDGCIIGAGAVVTKSIPEYTVAAGVPAKVIKKR